MRASGRRISMFDFANERFWQFAVLTAAGTLGVSSKADAALYYWNGPDAGYYVQAEPALPMHRQKARRTQAKTGKAAAEKETAGKPQGAVVISISIDQQKVRIYDANGLFAESPVSTGMKGHSTPMGVFSVIQKQKYHRSNIYSGAPMPYMQRITWSGVAMHAGVLPGYPASHGCIRMPMAFAVKMYNWTRMGARVFVTPGTLAPESFSHPLLVTQKVPAQPVADDIPKLDAPMGVKSDKGAEKPETSLELRSTVGHAEPPASLRDNPHTADASGAMPAVSTPATLSDASGSAVADASDDATKGAAGAVNAAASKTDASKADAATNDAAKSDVTATKAPKSGDVDSAVKDNTKNHTGDAVPADPAKSSDKSAERPAEPAKAADAPDAKKDPAPLPGLARADASRHAGQVAVFISRKDSRLYVRQNFEPLFDVPVTITASDRPLGTHVFTAEADKTNPNQLHWSVVTLPVRNVARLDVEDHASHRRKAAAAPVEARPQPDSPAEALDRITIPADTMARISEALGTGASIIVSDLGVNQGETGEGTDFIVPLR
ncbi:L,D-transpeptidase [Bradyrhizobium jicamae]|uniref:L,D-transpeptidase n=2 Tax=Bradyrhizobium jicamae TaxID=280332 RepID=A0ABS5FJ33_9BRAD|nr:L,D-transpeptidase [Bradyrhizobium jicamae]